MVNKGSHCFICPWWYCQGIVKEDRFGFCICFAGSSFDLNCQVWEIYEAICRVIDHTAFPHKVQNFGWPCQFLAYDEMLGQKLLSPISNLFVGVANGFSNLTFVLLN